MANLADFYNVGPPVGGDLLRANPTSQTADTITPLGDKPFATAERVKWSVEKTQEVWRAIDGGLKFQERAFKKQYHDATGLWKGEHWPEGVNASPYRGHLIANLIPNFVKALVEAVAFSFPEFTLTPWNQVGEQNQLIAKAALNYYWREARCQKELKRATYDRVIYGLGVVQEGWLFTTQEIHLDEGRLPVEPTSGSVYTTDQEQDAQTLDGRPARPVPADDVIDDRFQVRRVDPIDFLVASNATDVVEDWPWCAVIRRLPLADVKRNILYKNTAALKGDSSLAETYMADDIRALEEEKRPADQRYVELYDYYEIGRHLHIVLCRENPLKPLLVEKWQWESGRYPFRTTHGNHLPSEFYGKSIPVELWSLQIDINECATQLMEHRRQFNRGFQVPEDCLDDAALFALEEGGPGAVVEYKPGPWGNNPIEPIPHLQLQPEVYKSSENSMRLMEMLSGLSQYQLHNPPSKRLSATESQAIQQAGGILFMSDAQEFETLCEGIAEDLLDWSQQYAEVVREIPIFEQGAKLAGWANFSAAAIRGDYLVEVNVGSTQPPDTQQNFQKYQAALAVLAQALQMVNPQTGEMPRPIAIVMNHLLETIGMRHVDELMPIPPAHPMGGANPPGPPLPPGPQGPPPGPPAAAGAPPPPPPGQPPAPPIDPQQLQMLLSQMPPGLLEALLKGH